jgi:tetratricopeptide (TPR) repeat protein
MAPGRQRVPTPVAVGCYPRCVRAFRVLVPLALVLVAPGLAGAAAARHVPAVAPSPAPSPAAAEAFTLGRMLALEGSLPQALEQLQFAATASPRDAYVRLELAGVHLRLRQSSDALREARQAIALAPDDPDVLSGATQVMAPLAEDDPTVLVDVRRALEHLVQLHPNDPEALQMLARLYLAQGDGDAAEATLRKLAAAVPESPQVTHQLLQLLLQRNKRGDAADLLRQQLASDPSDLQTRLTLADLLSETGDHAGAVAVLRAASADQAMTSDVRRRLAFELYRSGDTAAAAQLVDQLLKTSSDSRLRLFRALLLDEQGKSEQAIHELEALYKESPDDAEVGLSLARMLSRGERREDARTVLEALLPKLAGDDAHKGAADRARLELAQLDAEDGRWSDALAQLDSLSGSSDELRAPATLMRVQALVATGKQEEALALLVPSSGLTAEALAARRAELLLGMGRESDAAAELQKVGGGAEGKARTAEVYQRAGQHARAIPLLEDLLAADPAANDVRFRLGAAYERAGQRDKAVATFRELLKRTPDSPMALNYLGYMWAEKGENLDEALKMVSRALELDPGNAAYLDSLGWVYFQKGQFPQAVEQLSKAARLLPGDGTVQEHLGDALRAAGKVGEARAAYERALAVGKDNQPAVRKKLDEIERASAPQ